MAAAVAVRVRQAQARAQAVSVLLRNPRIRDERRMVQIEVERSGRIRPHLKTGRQARGHRDERDGSARLAHMTLGGFAGVGSVDNDGR